MRALSGLLGGLLLATSLAAAERPADLLLLDASVVTMDPALPSASAVAIRDGRILAVGDTAEVSALRGPDTRVETLDGALLLPGFHDAHTHLVLGGVELGQCSLTGAADLAALRAAVQACVDSTPAGDWVVGGGWELSLFPAGNADKAVLDAISTAHPIYLSAADGHSGWANSTALVRAGISADTPDPAGGRIERDPLTGQPGGTLREAAQQLVQAVLPPVDAGQRLDGLRRAQAMAHRHGITAVVEAAASPEVLQAWEALADSGELALRVRASVLVSGELAYSPAPELLRPADRGWDRAVRADAAKVFVDGVLEGETAALLEPYLGADGQPVPGHRGDLVLAPDALSGLVTDLDARGIQVHLHAIGDRGVRVALDALAAARASNGPRDNRHHIAHLQLVHPADHARFATLGVSANLQALWAYPDAYITDINLPAVGRDRVARMYPFASLHRADARLVAGSDWSVSSMDPLLAMATAVTRSDPAGQVPGTLNSTEALPLDALLAAYTRDGAWLMHREHLGGTITAGKQADLVVLDRDVRRDPARDLPRARVLLTLFDGRVVYRADD